MLFNSSRLHQWISPRLQPAEIRSNVHRLTSTKSTVCWWYVNEPGEHQSTRVAPSACELQLSVEGSQSAWQLVSAAVELSLSIHWWVCSTALTYCKPRGGNMSASHHPPDLKQAKLCHRALERVLTPFKLVGASVYYSCWLLYFVSALSRCWVDDRRWKLSSCHILQHGNMAVSWRQ